MLKRSLPQNRPRHHYYDLIEKQWLAVDSYISRLELTKFGWESEPYVTHLLDGFSRLTPIHHIITKKIHFPLEFALLVNTLETIMYAPQPLVDTRPFMKIWKSGNLEVLQL